MHLIAVTTEGGALEFVNLDSLAHATFWPRKVKQLPVLQFVFVDGTTLALDGPQAEAVASVLSAKSSKAQAKKAPAVRVKSPRGGVYG